MKFAHISDTHLGARQYGLSEREDDVYHAFEDAVRKIIREGADFVVHSGDLFDSHRPQPRALWVAARCFSRLKQRGIPVFAVTGNHDSVLRRGAMPPHVLFGDLGVRLLTEEEPFAEHKGVLIAGCPYMPRFHAAKLRETLSILASRAAGHDKSVLVLHQGIEELLPHDFELSLSEVPGNFSYCALGHLHARAVRDFGRGKLAYSGSTELMTSAEFADYAASGKGFFMVDISGDMPEVRRVDVQPRREILSERLEAATLADGIESLKERISGQESKPLVFLEVDASGFDRKALHTRILAALAPHALSLRVSYAQAAPAEPAEIRGSFDVESMIREALKDDAVAALASQLFRLLSSGDVDAALEEAMRHYDGWRDRDVH